MKKELLLSFNDLSYRADKEVLKLERLQKRGIITPEEFEDIKNQLLKQNQ